jgi:hypothetical protein|tara:strand:+ start:496 stop:1437 length:942 start_codon:yes stop_codon:yes gene_type:complete
MTLATSAFTSFDAIGNREDLSDIIYNVAPTDTPFITGIPRTDAKAVLHEWQTDTLAAASSTNFVLEGDESTTVATVATSRLSNTCNISDKLPRVSGTQMAVNTAGRKDELAYQIVKVAKELRRDMESILLANNAEVTGNTTTARETGGIGAWIATNDVFGTGGASGAAGNTARTDGTQRPITEAMLKSVLASCWDAGGDPDCVMVGSFNKQAMSGFTGNATRWKGAADKQLVAAIDIYSSDFGDVEIIPNRFSRAREALVLQKDLWATAYLRPVTMMELSKTGDSERRLLLAEYALESRNEAGSGMVADLTTS